MKLPIIIEGVTGVIVTEFIFKPRVVSNFEGKLAQKYESSPKARICRWRRIVKRTNSFIFTKPN